MNPKRWSWLWTAVLAGILEDAQGDPAACDELRRAWWRAAESGLRFYAAATSTGAAILESTESRGKSAMEDLSAAVLAKSRFDQQVSSRDVVEVCGRNASLAHRLFHLLLESRSEGRERIAKGNALDRELHLMSEHWSWVELLHSGWPVFPLAALVENEFRDPPTHTLATARMDRQEPSEGCSADQEVFHTISTLFAAEGKTARIIDMRDFLRWQVPGDVYSVAGPQFMSDLASVDQNASSAGKWCWAAAAVAYAGLADALQCHWRRPRSWQMQVLADVAVKQAQRGALRAFGRGPKAFNGLIRSRWFLLTFLARLRPRQLWSPEMVARAPVLVSWSSREAELGGTNWARKFVQEVFGDLPGVELEEDLECADIYVYRSKAPVNFGGVLIFVDGERFPEDSLQENLLRNYPASIVVGPMPAGGLADFFPVPAASSSFAARVRDTPIQLTLPRPPGTEARQGFAAYLASRCYPHRDRFFALLDAAAHAAGLGRVEALSRCGNAPENRRSDRYSASYYDDAVDLFRPFRFAMVFENRLSPRYVTEKIVNAFLSGAIPIYWGTPYVMKMFNPNAFIYVNRFKSFEAAVEYVLEVARDPQLFADYARAPILRNTTAAVWPYSWHREAPPVEGSNLREALASLALEKHRAGLKGRGSAIERRPFEYAHLFT